MAAGGRVGFEAVAWFNGGLFDDGTALPLEAADIETVLAASDLDWSEIDPSILGTLFERGLDPGKRAQLGAHYTDRDKISCSRRRFAIRQGQRAGGPTGYRDDGTALPFRGRIGCRYASRSEPVSRYAVNASYASTRASRRRNSDTSVVVDSGDRRRLPRAAHRIQCADGPDSC